MQLSTSDLDILARWHFTFLLCRNINDRNLRHQPLKPMKHILLVFSRNFGVETNLVPLIRDIWYCFIKGRKLSSGHPLQNGSSFSQKNLDEDAMMLWWISLKLVFSSQLATCNHWSQTMCFHFLWETLYGMVGFHFSKLFLDFFILCEKYWQNWFI